MDEEAFRNEVLGSRDREVVDPLRLGAANLLDLNECEIIAQHGIHR